MTIMLNHYNLINQVHSALLYLETDFGNKITLMAYIPEIISFLLHSNDTRYHWIEHFVSGGAISEQGRIRRFEPKVTEPSKAYTEHLFSSAILLNSNCQD